MTKAYMNLNKKTARVVLQIFYTMDGDDISQSESPKDPWFDLIPDSIMEIGYRNLLNEFRPQKSQKNFDTSTPIIVLD